MKEVKIFLLDLNPSSDVGSDTARDPIIVSEFRSPVQTGIPERRQICSLRW